MPANLPTPRLSRQFRSLARNFYARHPKGAKIGGFGLGCAVLASYFGPEITGGMAGAFLVASTQRNLIIRVLQGGVPPILFLPPLLVMLAASAYLGASLTADFINKPSDTALSDAIIKAGNEVGDKPKDIASACMPFSLSITRDSWWHGIEGERCATVTLIPGKRDTGTFVGYVETEPLPPDFPGISYAVRFRRDLSSPSQQFMPVQ